MHEDSPICHVTLRSSLGGIPSYKAGKPAGGRAGMTTYKLSSNENPYPPLPGVLRVIEKAAADINRYPDMANGELTQGIARSIGVDVDQVVCGTGSVALLGQIIQATCDAGDEVVFPWRSFEAYPIVTMLAGASAVKVGLDADYRVRLDAMLAAITDRTRVVLICTPNNPTGPSVRADELDAFLAAVPDRVLVVLDEAYLEFQSAHDLPDAIAVCREHANVLVLRTFSKAYGLAGLRVGYAVAHPVVADALRKTAVPFGVNSLAQAAALASLELREELTERVDALVAERDQMMAALREQGWQVPDSQANFIYFPLGELCGPFAAACESAGLIVRRYGDDGVRVTVGESEANDRFLDVAEQFGPR